MYLGVTCRASDSDGLGGGLVVCFYEDAPAEWTKTALIPLHLASITTTTQLLSFLPGAVPSWGLHGTASSLLLRSSLLRCSQALPSSLTVLSLSTDPPLLPRAHGP